MNTKQIISVIAPLALMVMMYPIFRVPVAPFWKAIGMVFWLNHLLDRLGRSFYIPDGRQGESAVFDPTAKTGFEDRPAGAYSSGCAGRVSIGARRAL